MKLSQIQRGSGFAYREAVEIVRNQILLELETCERMLGTDPQKVLELLAQGISNRKHRGRSYRRPGQKGHVIDHDEDASKR